MTAKPKSRRQKTDYPHVFYREAKSRIKAGELEKVFYIYASIRGKLVEEKVGRESEGITAKKASLYFAGRLSRKIKSPKERKAEEEAEKTRKEVEKLVEENRYTISRLWESYKENRSIKGIKTDENRYKLHIKPSFGKKEPQEVIALEVQRLQRKLLKDRSPATVRNVLELFRRIVNYGVNNNLCNPLKFKIQFPKVNNQRTEDLSREQLTNLLKVIENSSHVIAGAMMKMALFTGMRRGEMFRLKWEHIDEEKGFIRIVDPKGGVDSSIPLNSAAQEVLDGLPKDSKFVFPGRKGKQRVDVNKAVAEIKTDAELPKDFRALHGLRHVFASNLASSGKVDLYTLQRLLTHKSPNMTMRYAHLRDEVLKQASNVAGDIVKDLANDARKIRKINE